MFLLPLGAFSQDLCEKPHRTAVLLSWLLTPLGCTCNASRQQSCSRSTCGEELLFSHLNVEATPGETTKYARWRDRDGTVSFRGLQTASGFFASFGCTSPSCVSFAGDRRCQQWEAGQDASGDQLFHPPPQTQVTLTKAKVDPAGLRWWRAADPWSLKLLPTSLPCPPNQRGKGSTSSPKKNPAGISSAAIHTTSPSY